MTTPTADGTAMPPPSRRDLPEWVDPLAAALAEALPRLHGEETDPLLTELIRALTQRLARGDLELPLQGPPPEGVCSEGWPQRHLRALRRSALSAEPHGPLALEDDTLLWRRWQQQREAVLSELVRRAGATGTERVHSLPAEDAEDAEAGDPAALRLDPLQQEAVAVLLERRFVLLEGGPGTGKTSTVAAMVEALRRREPQARIHLAAPTGRAAARLRTATGGSLPCTTLHRLLESRGDRFGRHRQNPLELDLVVVDEVSMVDTALMGALLEALPDSCRLVLVGDPAQLPPVAPGAVLADLQRPRWRDSLHHCAVTLRTPHRSSGEIAAVAARLRELAGRTPDPLTALRPDLLALPPEANLSWMEASPRTLPRALLTRLEEHRQVLGRLAACCGEAEETRERDLLRERDRLLVLAPLRRGRWGLEAIHRSLIGEAAHAPLQQWPCGTPVVCRRNLPELGLANGDVGILLGEGADPLQQRILFGEPEGEDPPFRVHPAQLAGAVDPALALTVHMAQGSEADEVIVVAPRSSGDDASLLYTALTRARQRALLITPCRAAGGPP